MFKAERLGRTRIHAGVVGAVANWNGRHEVDDPMTVHVVIREDQNEHGFIDASVDGLFRSRHEADEYVKSSIADARDEGLRVSDESGIEPDWDVSWKIEVHPVT